jgi:O-antigen ligase/polysaccharide polymerase Wzy-like membrane protein
MTRLVLGLYLTSLALLPWMWFPPFPWLHEHAQWSDAIFGLTAALWAIERWRCRQWPCIRPAHIALGLYFLTACLSLLFASPDLRFSAPKLLGVAELCTLAFITSDIASRPGASRVIVRVIAITSLVSAAVAIGGLILFYAGVGSPLIGIYGELDPSPWYARVQGPTYNPNLLASFCIFAAATVAHRDGDLPAWLRRLTLAALALTVILTFSRGILGFVLAAVIGTARTPRRRIVASVCAAVCVGVIIVLTVWNPAIDPTHPMDAHLQSVPSSRFQAATSSLIAIVRHPVFGSGLGTNPGRYRGNPFDAHCTPINIAATLGLPALIVFSFLIASLWRRRIRPTDLAIWGGLAGLALDGLAQDVEDFRHLWVMIGLAGSDPGGRVNDDLRAADAERIENA